jgi:hypothetical protein
LQLAALSPNISNISGTYQLSTRHFPAGGLEKESM